MTEPRIAVVTGAARGIGAALARRMAEDGFAVAAVDLSAEACADVVGQIEEAGGTARAFAAEDVSSERGHGRTEQRTTHAFSGDEARAAQLPSSS